MAAALGFVPAPDYSNWGERWIKHYGTETTFESYGAVHGDLQDLASRVPDRHKELLAALPWCVEHPAAFFVHAGIDPNTPFEMQLRILRQKDFSLNRPQWLCAKTLVEAEPPPDCPVPVVSGHVRVPQVSIKKRRILVDTTGGVGGDLSCVLLPERAVITSSSSHLATVGQSHQTRPWWKLWS
jgi:serine/threonine protein phosphatase 1